MLTRCFSIPYGTKSMEACENGPEDENNDLRCGLVLTHGAGGDMYTSQLTLLAEILAKEGFTVIRFTCKGLNLSYRIKVYTAVIEYVSANYKNLEEVFIAGRSMGARAAVGVSNAANGAKLDKFISGVISLSYPLHLKEKKSDLRDSSLYQLKKPSLFISATKDDMCGQEIFEKVLSKVTNYEIHWIPNADHSLKVKGSNENDIAMEIGEHISKWCRKYCRLQKESTIIDEMTPNKGNSKRKSKASTASPNQPKKTKLCED